MRILWYDFFLVASFAGSILALSCVSVYLLQIIALFRRITFFLFAKTICKLYFYCNFFAKTIRKLYSYCNFMSGMIILETMKFLASLVNNKKSELLYLCMYVHYYTEINVH